jgi:hypothetical protein
MPTLHSSNPQGVYRPCKREGLTAELTDGKCSHYKSTRLNYFFKITIDRAVLFFCVWKWYLKINECR